MRARTCTVLLAIAVALVLGAVARSAAGPAPSFAAARSYATGKGPWSVAIADLNGDGNPDLVTANEVANTVSVLVNHGDGSLESKRNYPTDDDPSSIAIADLNGDGKPDLVTANYLSETVSVLLNSGDGSFEPRRDYAASGYLSGELAIADVNGDGRPDLVTASELHTVSILLNRGDGSFEPKRDYATGRGPSIAVIDVNGDGKADLVTANVASNTVSILLNRGDGSFEPKRDYATGKGPSPLAVADLNGDGKPDVVTANSGSVSVLLNKGDGSFRAHRDYMTCAPCFPATKRSGSVAFAVAIADLNGDGKPDLATRNVDELRDGFSAGTVSVFLNKGGGTFKAQHSYRTGLTGGEGAGRWWLAINDLNGDAKPDLATANGANGISVLLNRGNGSFEPRLEYRIWSDHEDRASTPAVADLNGDGKPDVVAVDADASTVSVLINTPGLCNAQRVAGITLAAAKRKLARVNCRVGKVSRALSRSVKKDRVISQKPRFGAVRPKGSKVNLVVSRGPKG